MTSPVESKGRAQGPSEGCRAPHAGKAGGKTTVSPRGKEHKPERKRGPRPGREVRRRRNRHVPVRLRAERPRGREGARRGAGRAWWHPGGVEGQPVRARAPRATRRLSAAAPRLPCASCTPRPHRTAEDGVRPAGRGPIWGCISAGHLRGDIQDKDQPRETRAGDIKVGRQPGGGRWG